LSGGQEGDTRNQTPKNESKPLRKKKKVKKWRGENPTEKETATTELSRHKSMQLSWTGKEKGYEDQGKTDQKSRERT